MLYSEGVKKVAKSVIQSGAKLGDLCKDKYA